jgi:hypothetical protein
MNVKELKELLSHYEDSVEIYQSRDPEGNGYGLTSDSVAAGMMDDDSGEFLDDEYIEEDEIEVDPSWSKCIVLFPEY